MNWHTITDFFWPTLEGTEQQEPDHIPWKGTVDNSRESVRLLTKAQDDRLQTTDNKLQGLLPLATIAATLVLALVTFVTKEQQDYTAASVILIVVGGVYVTLQFIRTIWAAVNGLGVRAFKRITPSELAPHKNETTEQYQARIIDREIECLTYNTWVADNKVSDLKLAYHALKNALRALILLVVLLGSIAVLNAVH